MNQHRRLLAWQEARRFVAQVYRVTASFPPAERFGMTSQMRRAAVSVAANIAEGFGRSGVRETAHSLSISLGSLAELDTLVAVAHDIGLLSRESVEGLETGLANVSKLTFGLHRSVRAKSGR